MITGDQLGTYCIIQTYTTLFRLVFVLDFQPHGFVVDSTFEFALEAALHVTSKTLPVLIQVGLTLAEATCKHVFQRETFHALEDRHGTHHAYVLGR